MKIKEFFRKQIPMSAVFIMGSLILLGQTCMCAATFHDLTVLGNTFLATQGGYVGIGTTEPYHKLEVGSIGRKVASTISIVGERFVGAVEPNTNKTFYLGLTDNGNGDLTGELTAYDYDKNSQDPAALLDISIPGSNLGIGTLNPQSRLHVHYNNDNDPMGSTGITIDIPGIGTRQILVGSPDSAGPGFRTLQVTN